MEHRDRLNRLSESGGVGVPLEDYWKEFSSFDEGGQGEEDEEDISKTPDDMVVFRREYCAVPNIPDRTIDHQSTKLSTSFKTSHKSLSTLHSEPLSMSMRMSVDNSNLSTSAPAGERWTRKTTLPLQKSSDESPSAQQSSKLNTRALPPLTFLRTGHTGGFSLRDRTRGIDCESPTSVEVLKYESRKSTIQEKDTGSMGSLNSVSTEPFSLETGFQEISSRMNSVSDLVVSYFDSFPIF
ncbi:hypothetical protein AVEN_90655-1 [Araneus ventricosus]|uniref:Uncharacterized protein n=1 Tax=Araneus ventricosus TaxID=182803 RepID=A0A4Y2HJN3_ARAVE|nr:hypothetical protein AVEN_90655-1 [Araneus ventricosus]